VCACDVLSESLETGELDSCLDCWSYMRGATSASLVVGGARHLYCFEYSHYLVAPVYFYPIIPALAGSSWQTPGISVVVLIRICLRSFVWHAATIGTYADPCTTLSKIGPRSRLCLSSLVRAVC
jgi:hypothetical protein